MSGAAGGDPGAVPAAAAAEQWRALAPALAARGLVRLSYDGGRNYPARFQPALTRDPPPCPAAVHIYDDDGMTRVLAADFDVKLARARGAADPAEQVTADAAAFAALIASCGARGFGDVSPNGGRHGYVLWAAPVHHEDISRVALALARRFPSLDPSPMLGRRHGIIRPPGSRHRTGGYQLLTSPLGHARRCAAEPNGPAAWNRLLTALADDLAAVGRGESPAPSGPETAPDGAAWRLDEHGAPWLPRPGGKVPRLRADLELTAVTGFYDATRYPTSSEARLAVLGSAAARGWRLEDIAARLRGGRWDGLNGFYGKYPGRQRDRRLAAEWKKAVASAYGRDSGRPGHTRENYHGGGAPGRRDHESGSATDYRDYEQIRRWDCSLRAGEQQRWPGAHGITIRLVVRALAAAAQLTGSVVIEFGARSLGLLACLDHSTVARVLAELREENDPYLELLQRGRGLRADLYALRIPEAHASAAAWRRWRPGRFGVHPVFRVLGGAAALLCEQLTAEPVRTTDLPDLTGLSATTVSEALAELAAHGIAVRERQGWRRGPAALGDVAEQLGVPELIEALQARYRDERERWRGRLMLVPAPPAAPPPADDIPWPDSPPDDDEEHVGEAAPRAPPAGAGMTDATAVIEAVLGPVRVITAA